jgi:hypothetical protein
MFPASISWRRRTPQEAARILGESIDFSRKGQIAVRDGGAGSRGQAAKP